jgi:hypothetical protein
MEASVRDSAGYRKSTGIFPTPQSTRRVSSTSLSTTPMRIIRSWQECKVESVAGLYSRQMEVRFSPEIEVQLNKLATRAGKDAEFIVQDLIRRLIYHDEAIAALLKDSATAQARQLPVTSITRSNELSGSNPAILLSGRNGAFGN